MVFSHSNVLGVVAMGVLLSMAPDTAQASGDEYCREYTKRVVIGGRTEESYGTACLRPDGQWEIQNEPAPVRYDVPAVNRIPPRVTYVVHDTRPRYAPYWTAAYPPPRYYHVHKIYDRHNHRGRSRHDDGDRYRHK